MPLVSVDSVDWVYAGPFWAYTEASSIELPASFFYCFSFGLIIFNKPESVEAATDDRRGMRRREEDLMVWTWFWHANRQSCPCAASSNRSGRAWSWTRFARAWHWSARLLFHFMHFKYFLNQEPDTRNNAYDWSTSSLLLLRSLPWPVSSILNLTNARHIRAWATFGVRVWACSLLCYFFHISLSLSIHTRGGRSFRDYWIIQKKALKHLLTVVAFFSLFCLSFYFAALFSPFLLVWWDQTTRSPLWKKRKLKKGKVLSLFEEIWGWWEIFLVWTVMAFGDESRFLYLGEDNFSVIWHKEQENKVDKLNFEAVPRGRCTTTAAIRGRHVNVLFRYHNWLLVSGCCRIGFIHVIPFKKHSLTNVSTLCHV